MNKADLILHPARVKIIQALAQNTLTIQELSELLPDLPKSSIYRHMRALLDGGMVQVAGSRPVKGTPENFYQLASPPHLTQSDLEGFSPQDHQRYFAMFMAAQLQEFADYLQAYPQANFEKDMTGYTQAVFWASQEELERFGAGLQALVAELMQNPPSEDRHQHKVAFILHPFAKGETKND
jgi:DNA-binding transcriptional ArsR family regulator